MVCLGIEPGAAGWKARTNPLSYGGTPLVLCVSDKEAGTIPKLGIYISYYNYYYLCFPEKDILHSFYYFDKGNIFSAGGICKNVRFLD